MRSGLLSAGESQYVADASVLQAPGLARVQPHSHHQTIFKEEMLSFVVEGGQRLSGRLRPAGNKNAALPALAATVLTSQPVTLENVPRIRDVETMLEIIESLGASVRWDAANTVTVDASGVTVGDVDRTMAERIRASLLLAGPLLARFGSVRLPPPGGDVIGKRRLDTHFLAFEALGASVELDNGLHLEAGRLKARRSGRAFQAYVVTHPALQTSWTRSGMMMR